MGKKLPGPVMIDVSSTSLSKEEIKRLKHPLVGGVILFARNYKNHKQLAKLTQHIRQVRKAPLLIAVDHEGGRVQRFKDNGFTHLPSMRKLGEYWERNPLWAMKVASDIGYVLAAELRACGVDLTFAPVLDLDYGISEVIGTRSFHSDPRVVTMLSRALVQGLAQAGMAACGKHFPGHGFVDADSHTDLPVDPRQLDDILVRDVMPYEWLGDGILPAIMPAHVLYPAVDSNNACFSSVWIQDILRKRLNYQGMVFSDDLTMEGASGAGNITQRAKAALGAGCDMVLVCNKPKEADELLHTLDTNMSKASVKRLLRLIPCDYFMGWKKLQKNVQYLNARAFQAEVISW